MLGATQRSDGWWSIYYEKTYNDLIFRDAIVLSPIEYTTMSETQLSDLMQIKFDNWVALLNAVPDPEPEIIIEEPEIIEPVVETVVPHTRLPSNAELLDLYFNSKQL